MAGSEDTMTALKVFLTKVVLKHALMISVCCIDLPKPSALKFKPISTPVIMHQLLVYASVHHKL